MSKRQEPGRRRAQESPNQPLRLSRALVLFAVLGIAGAILAGVLLWQWSDDELSGLSAADPGPVHVHGLGVNPADGALFIATHTGLYRVDAGWGIGGHANTNADIAAAARAALR
jgi:hypothetical protein